MPDRTAAIVLASLDLRGLAEVVAPGRVLLVPAAADHLDDRAAVVEATRGQLVAQGWDVVEVDLRDGPVPADLGELDVDAVCCSGGDPYHLLAEARRTGLADVLRRAVDQGTPYVGCSAGALVAGPSLAPVEHVSPFPRPPGRDVAGLGLTDLLVLPHDERPGRRARHERALRDHGRDHQLLAITDDELVVVGPAGWRLLHQPSGRCTRPARPGDGRAIADAVAAAGRAAWGFLGDGLATWAPPARTWEERIAGQGDPDALLVVEDGGAIAGVAWVHPADGTDLPPGTGELGAWYTRPDLWGSGTGRRLLALALDRLRAAGATDVVVSTEGRNDRPRAIYERLGWRADGTSRRRRFLDQDIVEPRLTRRL